MNYADWYTRISKPFRSVGARRALAFLDRALVYGFAAAYVLLLVYLAVFHVDMLVRAVVVPAIVFAGVTIARIAINKPRPYERERIDPLIEKDTRGKSMPSRHMASAVVIACAFLWVNPLLGAVAFIACALVAFARIVGGVHYPIDIAVAAAVALLAGIVGFFVVP